jgi:hypothetical protein
MMSKGSYTQWFKKSRYIQLLNAILQIIVLANNPSAPTYNISDAQPACPICHGTNKHEDGCPYERLTIAQAIRQEAKKRRNRKSRKDSQSQGEGLPREGAT